MTCCLQAGGPEKPVVWFYSTPVAKEPGRSRNGGFDGVGPGLRRLKNQSTSVWMQEKVDVPAQAEKKPALPLPFCSNQ